MTRFALPAALALLALAVADWALLRAGRLDHDPAWLALLVLAVLLGLAVRLGHAAARLAARPGRTLRAAGEVGALAGLICALGTGLANFSLRLQGAAIALPRERVSLRSGEGLDVFEAGLLADLAEADAAFTLLEVDLAPAGPGGFEPVSRLRVERRGEPPADLVISPGRRAEHGALRFHQGAFGFAPRIVVRREGAAFFDRVVPFRTERSAARGLSFGDTFTIEREGLSIAGSVSLDSLDGRMRGHPTLELVVTRRGEPLGGGPLLPGHFADLGQGYSVGFAGLERWSEVVISRRTYPAPVLAGLAAAALGALAAAAGAIRERLRARRAVPCASS